MKLRHICVLVIFFLAITYPDVVTPSDTYRSPVFPKDLYQSEHIILFDKNKDLSVEELETTVVDPFTIIVSGSVLIFKKYASAKVLSVGFKYLQMFTSNAEKIKKLWTTVDIIRKATNNVNDIIENYQINTLMQMSNNELADYCNHLGGGMVSTPDARLNTWGENYMFGYFHSNFRNMGFFNPDSNYEGVVCVAAPEINNEAEVLQYNATLNAGEDQFIPLDGNTLAESRFILHNSNNSYDIIIDRVKYPLGHHSTGRYSLNNLNGLQNGRRIPPSGFAEEDFPYVFNFEQNNESETSLDITVTMTPVDTYEKKYYLEDYMGTYGRFEVGERVANESINLTASGENILLQSDFNAIPSGLYENIGYRLYSNCRIGTSIRTSNRDDFSCVTISISPTWDDYENVKQIGVFQGNNIGEVRYFSYVEDSPTDWPRDTETEIVDVTNPATGQTWMDRNLGASRAATSPTDEQAYGDLYQWGRAADGHQKRTSSTTSELSSSDLPGHGNFILATGEPYSWRDRDHQNYNLWQRVSKVNNPCPPGYRLPTLEEWRAEVKSWSSNDSNGAFASPLKLPTAGARGMMRGRISPFPDGYYWSATADSGPWILQFRNKLDRIPAMAQPMRQFEAYGFSVRCIKD